MLPERQFRTFQFKTLIPGKAVLYLEMLSDRWLKGGSEVVLAVQNYLRGNSEMFRLFKITKAFQNLPKHCLRGSSNVVRKAAEN